MNNEIFVFEFATIKQAGNLWIRVDDLNYRVCQLNCIVAFSHTWDKSALNTNFGIYHDI